MADTKQLAILQTKFNGLITEIERQRNVALTEAAQARGEVALLTQQIAELRAQVEQGMKDLAALKQAEKPEGNGLDADPPAVQPAPPAG